MTTAEARELIESSVASYAAKSHMRDVYSRTAAAGAVPESALPTQSTRDAVSRETGLMAMSLCFEYLLSVGLENTAMTMALEAGAPLLTEEEIAAALHVGNLSSVWSCLTAKASPHE